MQGERKVKKGNMQDVGQGERKSPWERMIKIMVGCSVMIRGLRRPKHKAFSFSLWVSVPHTGSLVFLLMGKHQLGCPMQRLRLQNRVWEVSWWLCQAADAKCWGHCSALLYLPAATCSHPRCWWFHSLVPACCIHTLPVLCTPLADRPVSFPAREASSPQGHSPPAEGRERHQTPWPDWHWSSRQHHPSFITSRELGWHRFGLLGAQGVDPLLTCQHSHVSRVLASGSKRFPRSLPLTNATALTL